ncbi:MAG TPA: hypothetical protein VGI71_10820 [Scandinavium sp.]|jgi:hypothetical protein
MLYKDGVLFIGSILTSFTLCASEVKHLSLSMGAFAVTSKIGQARNILSSATLTLPAICQKEVCPRPASLTLYDGSTVRMENGENYYRAVINGLDIGIAIPDESLRTLKQGKGGKIVVSVFQGTPPYHTGAFSKSLLTYGQEEEPQRIAVGLEGSVAAGSCIITEGEALSFTLRSTQAELAQHRGSKRMIESKKIAFSCVNVNAIDLRFSASSTKSGDPSILFDKATGAGVSFTWQANGASGDILWNNTPVTLPVADNNLSVMMNAFWQGGNERIMPGVFTFNGIWHADYH